MPVDVAISSDTVEAEIRYTTDGSQPTSNSDLYSAPIHLIEPVTVKARAYKEGMYQSEMAQAWYRPTKSPKAIIVAGGDQGNYLWPATKLVTAYAYKALIYQGYDKEDIIFLSAVTDIDVDGNGALDDIDGPAESSALQDAITNWALDAESLLLFMTDHGDLHTFHLSPSDVLQAADLDLWLDTLQESMDGPVMVVYDACRSGTFLQPLTPAAGKKRIVITSASDERAWFSWEGKISFSYQFWASIFGNANIYDAFDRAKRSMHGLQTALLDANGDGIGGENEDRLLAKDISIGRGIITASIPPQIGYVSPPRTLDTEISASIVAKDITSLNSIERVWAIIIPPHNGPELLDVPVTDMEEADLVDPDGDGTFEGIYEDFISDGVYNIVVYVRDSEGLFSDPMSTKVIKGTVMGDINNDGSVDLADLMVALQCLSGVDMSGMIRADYAGSGADVNGDNKVGMEEAVYILRYVSGL